MQTNTNPAPATVPMTAVLEVKRSMEQDFASKRDAAARALRRMILTATRAAEQLEQKGVDAPYSPTDFIGQDAERYAEALTQLNAIAEQYRRVLWLAEQAAS